MATLGTFTAGQVLTAAELNQFNNVTALYLATAQGVVTSTATAAIFGSGSEVVDVSGWHSETTNNTRITPNKAGIYLVEGGGLLNHSGASVNFECSLRKNGTFFAASLYAGTFFPIASASGIIEMNGTTDYLELFCYQDSGVNKNVENRRLTAILLRTT